MGSGLFGPKFKAKIIFVGLDGSGKTTILKTLQGKMGETVPTIGYGKESFQSGEVSFEAVDMSGQSKYRNLWANFSKEVDAVVFVIDSSDRLRLKVAVEQIKFLQSSELRTNVPFLFYFNKIDLPEAVPARQIAEVLQLQSLARPFFAQPCDGRKEEGVVKGLRWLVSVLEQNHIE